MRTGWSEMRRNCRLPGDGRLRTGGRRMTPVQAIATAAGTQVRPYENALETAWDDYVHRHPSGTLFHLTAWKRAIEKTFGYEPRYLVVEDRGKIRGVLPLFLVHNPVQGTALIS